VAKHIAKLPPPPAWHASLRTAGVTGTNGKTSTTIMLAAALGVLASPVPQVTTVGAFLDREPFATTPDYPGFLKTMRAAVDRGGRYAAIELTSEALAIGFARAWPCEVGVFTNLTRDHLDAHGSAEHYLASKAQLFMQLPPGGTAVLNGADPACALLAEVVPAHAKVLRYGVPSRGAIDPQTTLVAEEVALGWDGTRVRLSGTSIGELVVPVIGEVFAENGLAALGGAIAFGVEPAAAARAIAAVPPPRGRFEVVARAPYVVVDYAHTPDALRRTLATARALCHGTLSVVFGAGGQRDQPKRPLMGDASTEADRVIVTSDNPRGEDPAEIAAQIKGGMGGKACETILDRAQAIAAAITAAGRDDVVVIAGKGHETTQSIGGETRNFSDVEVAHRALAERA
jgi:UDP-N-acetylmuramoyl-L-alanyl-D-glutamate--2,6-diaminopimelate ligase